ncbi:NAD-dependent epimerase/dehydratase family protein [Paracoccus sp. YIM 132242]|uniref:NAD-dependent epimerase/dehydratase family protein n=1 Tax=Paracoccus lichenicola TaxID=2665644 RepID=A0A6L6HS23_9RHOB|nr:NAD-dependent epimerase/dehydratase family protein [Paracoccus lichenicola]MTE01100.1 NAD-dependent epimerase/dehydratase family protein [Paracoccus lichenicola]
MTVLITGAAGFIGFHLARRLLAQGARVIGLDDHNPYYDPALKAAREAQLLAFPRYHPVRGGVETPGLLARVMERHRPRVVVHLAAQAGVRHSIEAPGAYASANLAGTFQLLEAARAFPPDHLIMASSSSVYGGSDGMPCRETDPTDRPLSFYAATKKASEAMAHSYAALYGLPITMLRFFTVYGPWGRPDMAPFLFTSALFENRPIPLFNHGRLRRDFTYVDDLVEAIDALIGVVPHHPAIPVKGDSLSPVAPFRVVNIGNGEPIPLIDFIAALEAATGRKAALRMLPMQPGDVEATWADTSLLQRLIGPRQRTPVALGLRRHVEWFASHYPAVRPDARVLLDH